VKEISGIKEREDSSLFLALLGNVTLPNPTTSDSSQDSLRSFLT